MTPYEAVLFCHATIKRVIFEGEIFREFHESSSIRENFTLEIFLFSGYSTQSVTICENFALEKLGKLNSQKFSPSKIIRYGYMVYSLGVSLQSKNPKIY